jgi:hypothetical protein
MTRLRTLTAAAVATLGVGACGSGNSQLTTLDHARSATIARGTMQESITLVAGKGPATLTGDGAYDLANRRGRFSVTLPAIPPLPPGAKADAVVQLPTVYANIKGIPLPKPWIKADLRALPSAPGVDTTPLKAIELVDPNRPLTFLLGATGAVQVVGTETVRNVTATHETVTVDLDKALPKTAGDDATFIRADIAAFTSPTFPMDVWVGTDGLIHKLAYAVMAMGAQGGVATQQRATMELYGFGTPVAADAPPAAQTADIASLLAP